MAVPDGYTLVGKPNRWKIVWRWLARIHIAAAVVSAGFAVYYAIRASDRDCGPDADLPICRSGGTDLDADAAQALAVLYSITTVALLVAAALLATIC